MGEERESFERRCAALEAELRGTQAALASAQAVATALGGERDELASSSAMAVASAQAIAAELADVREQLAAAASAHASLHAAADTDAAAHADADAVASIRARVERFDALGIDVDDIPGLVDAATRLTVLEQDELPAMLSRAEAQRQEQETAFREELTAAASDRDRATASLAEAAQQVANLESELASTSARTLALEDELRAARSERVAAARIPSTSTCPTNMAGSCRTSPR